jgi:WD40 repeat protein
MRNNPTKIESAKEIYREKVSRFERNCVNRIYTERPVGSNGYLWSAYVKDRMLILNTITGFDANDTGLTCVIDLNTANCIQTLNTGTNVQIFCCCYAEDNKFFLGGNDQWVRVWNLQTNEWEQILEQHTSSISSLHFIKGRRLIVGTDDNKINIWDLNTGQCEMTLCEGHSKGIHFLCSTADEKLISLDRAGVVKLWDLKKGTCERTFSVEETGIALCGCLTEEGLLVLGNDRGEIKVLNLDAADPCKDTFSTGEGKCLIYLGLTKQGMLIAADNSGDVTLWDLETGQFEPLHLKRNGNYGSSILTQEGELIRLWKGIWKGEHSIVDLNASNREVFAEIAECFERGVRDVHLAYLKFQRMPDEEKEKIYLELDYILETEDCGEMAFLDYQFDDQIKAQAIRNYLSSLDTGS